MLVTDSAYKIDMKNGYNIHHLIYSFYNSLTLAFAELSGRYFGGGVLELTPSEFKSLPVPYLQLSDEAFNQFRKAFENKLSINNIFCANDNAILNTSLGLSNEEINGINVIYKKLVAKRLRK